MVDILVVASECSVRFWGGVGRYVQALTAYSLPDWQVTVLSIPSYTLDSREDAADHQGLRRVSSCEWEYVDREFSALMRSDSFDMNQYKKLSYRILEGVLPILSEHYDVVYVQDFYNVGIVGALHRHIEVDHVSVAAHLPLSARFSYFDKATDEEQQQALEAALLRISDSVVVASRFAKRNLELVYNVSETKVHIVPLGVEKTVRKKSRNKSEITLGSVMRFTDQKGLAIFPKMLSALESEKLNQNWIIIGSGPKSEFFSEAFSRIRNEGRIRHIGFAEPTKEIFDLYREMDIYVSTSAYETFGLAILEAMSVGCPPVGFNVSAVGELIENGKDGFLVPPNDCSTLAATIANLTINETLYTRVSDGAYEKAQNYSWARHMGSLHRCVWGLK